jgi:hypothetical protein
MKPITTIKGNWHKKSRSFNRVTILLPADSKMPTMRGKWQRLADGRIRAWYTPDELEQCEKLFELRKQADEEQWVNV